MNVEQQIKSVLAADGTVAALVTADSIARIYPVSMPQDVTMPAVCFQRVSTVPVNDLGGTQDHDWVRVQVDSWASTYSGAKALAAAVRTAMRTTPVYGQLLMELDDYDDVVKLYRVIQDFTVYN